ncbi:MAG TPA: nucleotidyltransferase family protein [Thermoanaerobaculaceae bacterium]|nr:nucleotidyltransferase family protein [Thermoanaerobaculaceae bacterium]
MSDPGRIDCATRWVLARALFPPDFPVGLPEDKATVWAEAHRLRLAARIASRCGRIRLASELGELLAERFQRASHHAALGAIKAEGQVRYLAHIAEENGLEFALLKGGALHVLRLASLGARPLLDLDILMEAKAARKMQRLLKSEGWVEHGSFRTDFHLPPLRHPAWLPLEIHDLIPRVSLDGRLWSGFEEVRSAGLMEPCRAVSVCVHAPARELLAAHALVAREVLTVPGLVDFLDLRLAQHAGGTTVHVEHAWVATQLSASKFQEATSAAGALACALRAEVEPHDTAMLAMEEAARVFDERLRPTWVSALRPKKGSPTPWRGAVLRILGRAFPPASELDHRYGRPALRVAYSWLYARRLVAILWRLTGGRLVHRAWGPTTARHAQVCGAREPLSSTCAERGAGEPSSHPHLIAMEGSPSGDCGIHGPRPESTTTAGPWIGRSN